MTSSNQSVEPYLGIASDLPKTDPEFDEFGYADFAKLLARAVRETPSPQGLVMAIHGPWGSGKSTLLNFIKHNLDHSQENNRPVVIDFNPWWFDDRKQLASQFLSQFSKKLKLAPSKISRAGDLMAQYSDALGKAVAFSTGHAWLDRPISWALRFFKLKTKDLPALKKEIGAALTKANQRYVFIVDDIDRLTAEETREVFKVIKALADFPNVIYLLSFDRTVVASALSDIFKSDVGPGKSNGEAYLEKIVQAAFTIPPVSKEKLHKKLFSDLDRIIDGSDLSLFDESYWRRIFTRGISKMLTKPRDIVRYTNVLSVTYPAVRNEVNIVDFFALEFLRLMQPDLYQVIAENAELFSGLSSKGLGDSSRKSEKQFHDVWRAKLDERIRPSVEAILHQIFPRLDDTGRSGGFLSEWRISRRAASPDVFSTYFLFALDPEELSREQMIAFTAALDNDEEAFRIFSEGTTKRRADGSTKAKQYVSLSQDIEQDLTPARAHNLLRAIMRSADSMLSADSGDRGFFSIPYHWSIAHTVQHALEKIPLEERDAALLSAASESESISFLTLMIRFVLHAKKEEVRHGPSAVLNSIKEQTVTQLKEIAVEKIHKAVTDEHLIHAPLLPTLLHTWQEWTNPNEAKEWTEREIQNPKRLAILLAAFVSETYSTGLNDSSTRVTYNLNLKYMRELIDLDSVNTLIDGLEDESALSERERLAIKNFKRQYSNLKNGIDDESD